METGAPQCPEVGVLAESQGQWGWQDHTRPPGARLTAAGGKGLTGRPTQLCSPIPVAVLLRLVTGPMWGRWARAAGQAWLGWGGGCRGWEMGPRPTPYAPPGGL